MSGRFHPAIQTEIQQIKTIAAERARRGHAIAIEIVTVTAIRSACETFRHPQRCESRTPRESATAAAAGMIAARQMCAVRE